MKSRKQHPVVAAHQLYNQAERPAERLAWRRGPETGTDMAGTKPLPPCCLASASSGCLKTV